jgi:hypothetical protein
MDNCECNDLFECTYCRLKRERLIPAPAPGGGPTANDRQVGLADYKKGYGAAAIQHWDFAAANDFDYFQGQITKYVTRWKNKNGVKDLEKAQHFLEKYIEVVKTRGGK